jgi:two-component system CheB/CheR fusion protein
MPSELERRILILAPTSKDAELTCKVLIEKQIGCCVCNDVAGLAGEMERGVGAVLLAEEALVQDDIRLVLDNINRQPPWSDLPVIVITRHAAESPANARAINVLGNVLLLERPTRLKALVNAAQSALRARRRQFQARDLNIAREQAARALQDSEERYRTLVEQIRDYAIFMVDLDGRPTSWNEGVRRVLGFEEAAFLGADISVQIFTPEDVAQGIPELELQQAATTGTAGNDRWMRRRDGSRFWASGVTTAVRNPVGQLIGYSKVMRDLTDHKHNEEALKQADRRKDEFLATLAHELRNPLAPLRNSLNILQLTASGDPATERICETMERQVNHLVRLVDDLLEVSRITRGKIELRREVVELASVARNAIETSRPLIDAAGIQLAISLPQERITLYGDPVRLGQIFANLLNNAAKYTNEGGQIWFTARSESGEAVISVRDTGIGIPKDVLPKVFDMFMQVDRATNRSQGGLGIGLTLVRSLVELHSGSVSAQSDGPGTGSEFVVRLPLAKAEAKSQRPHEPLAPARALPFRRILVVDDNVDSAATLGMLLKFLGADVQTANDGRAALDAIGKYKPDVVLLDIGMPGMDGFEVAKQIRTHNEFDNITLIALTGWGQEDDRRRTREAGFDHHLVKPADISALQALLVSLD